MISQRIGNPLFPWTDAGAGTKKENEQKKKQERDEEQMHKLELITANLFYHIVRTQKTKYISVPSYGINIQGGNLL